MKQHLKTRKFLLNKKKKKENKGLACHRKIMETEMKFSFKKKKLTVLQEYI